MASAGTRPVLVASVISGVSGYAVLVIVARYLTVAQNSDFLVYWGVLFGLLGAIGGVLNESARAVASARRGSRPHGALHRPTGPADGRPADGRPADGRPADGRPVAIGGSVAAFATMTAGGLLVVVLGSGLVWAPALFGANAWPMLTASAVGAAGFVLYSALAGAHIGRGFHRGYAALLATDGLGRLLLVSLAVALALHPKLPALAWATGSACFGWLLWIVASPEHRRSVGLRSDVTDRRLLGQSLTAMAASSATAALIVGFPVLVKVTSDPAEYASAAPLLLAVSLSRAPILLPLNAFQGVFVARAVTGGFGALRPVILAVAAVTPVGAALAWALGPWLLRLIRPDYVVTGPTFAALVVGAALVALLTVTGAVVLGMNRHAWYAVGWLSATAVSAAVLLLPTDLTERTILALIIGPAVGVLAQSIVIARAARAVGPRSAGDEMVDQRADH